MTSHVHIQDFAAVYPVVFVGAGPGAVEHLTLGALQAIRESDVVVYDRLVGNEVLTLIPSLAQRFDVGKEGFAPSTSQEKINTLLVAHVQAGRRVVRLKGGDCGIFGRLDEEIAALEGAHLPFRIQPGLTSAVVAAANIGQSLTRRGRNKALRIMTGHDMAGFAEQDWRSLVCGDEICAIYMGRKSARFIQGRLLAYGANPSQPITLVENVSCPDQRIIASNLARLADDITACSGPVVILYGLMPRHVSTALPELLLQEA